MSLTDQEFDIYLATRPIEPPSADLAQRILFAARTTPQVAKPSLAETLRATFEFLMPHPAAAFASVLALGLVMGISVSGITRAHDNILYTYTEDTGAML